jgi:hypothetical protein
MRQQAERYCALIEAAEAFEREAFVAALVPALAGLISAGAELRAVSPTNAELAYRPSHVEWKERLEAVQGVLREWTYYRTTFTTLSDHDQAASMAFLDDDLADIWRDMKHGLQALADAAALADVTWEWRMSFYTHWGEHATQALRALHDRLTENGGFGALNIGPDMS